MVLKRILLFCGLMIAVSMLGACTTGPDESILFSWQKSPTVDPTALPLPAIPRVLSICLGEEPRSLFIYGDLSSSANIIRQAIYDAPVDLVNFQQSSVLLEQIPSLENGLVTISEVEVFPGDQMVDASGNRTVLAPGVIYRPSRCTSTDCWQEYVDQESILLDVVEIIFDIKFGLEWADGEPLTPQDSVFSYHVARQIYTSTGPAQNRFTAAYELTEENRILWKGLPGFKGIYSYADYFFPPLPEHIWLNLTREEFLTSFQTTQKPLAWGAYQVLEWVHGDHITLEKNENYHASSDQSPAFDSLVFRFVDGGEEALAAYSSGECQVILNEPGLADFQTDLMTDQSSGKLKVYFVGGSAWEQLSFGINSLNPGPSLLNDKKLRHAAAQCIDRESISASRLDAGSVSDDFFLPGDPRFSSTESLLEFDPIQAGLDLRDLGWIDHDGDPATPRLAEGVDQVQDGTALSFTLLASGTDDLPVAVELISSGLNRCGIGVEVQLLPPAELLAPGPDGPIFGRKFDLALFSWTTGNYQPCRLFTSIEIPGLYPEFPKGWGGVNATGYSNQEFDQACGEAHTNLPDAAESILALEQIRLIYRADLPALPLFFRNNIIVADPVLEGFENGFYSLFWNIDNIR